VVFLFEKAVQLPLVVGEAALSVQQPQDLRAKFYLGRLFSGLTLFERKPSCLEVISEFASVTDGFLLGLIDPNFQLKIDLLAEFAELRKAQAA
jgi:hypothetical protein